MLPTVAVGSIGCNDLAPPPSAQAVEESEQVGFVACDIPFIDAAEMPDQLAAKPGDIFPVRLRRRLEGEIAFGVRAHRAVVEVGRTHAQDAIVDDHHLAVHHDGRGLAASRVDG